MKVDTHVHRIAQVAELVLKNFGIVHVKEMVIPRLRTIKTGRFADCECLCPFRTGYYYDIRIHYCRMIWPSLTGDDYNPSWCPCHTTLYYRKGQSMPKPPIVLTVKDIKLAATEMHKVLGSMVQEKERKIRDDKLRKR